MSSQAICTLSELFPTLCICLCLSEVKKKKKKRKKSAWHFLIFTEDNSVSYNQNKMLT